MNQSLAACRILVVDSENRPRRARFLLDSPPHSHSMGQEAGEKGAVAVGLQPTIPKSDRLLRRQHFLGVCTRRIGQLDAAQHAGDFLDAFGMIQHSDA